MHASNTSYVYCPGCGYVAPSTARFCVKCGASFAGAATASGPLPNQAGTGATMPVGMPAPQQLCLDNGRYTNVVPLSDRGGMGLIFRACDSHQDNKPCVIKQLRPDPGLDEGMFQREAELLSKLRHLHIPACRDFFTENGTHYLVSDLIEGRALQDVIEQDGPAQESAVIRWGIHLCDALAYIHSQQPPIVHRDIKPDNVIITPEGDAVLVDFGIARRYEEGKRDTMKIGTWGYLPPEQKAGRTEPRSDLYALGGTLYFALTGKDPQLINIIDINLQWRKDISFPPVRAANPTVSAELEAILLQATRVVAEQRYASASEMLDELRHLHASQQTSPCPYCQQANLLSATHCTRCNRALTTQAAVQRLPQNWTSFRGNAARTGVSETALHLPLKQVCSFHTQGAVDGSPIIANGIIYAASRDSALYAFDISTQRQLWRYSTGASLRSTPTISGDTLFLGDDDGILHAVQSMGGSARWRVPLGGKIFASVAAGTERIIAATQAGLAAALNPINGEVLWEQRSGSPFYASPAIYSNLVILCNGQGQVKALDLTSGKALWTFQTAGPIRATPACQDGLVLVAGPHGSLALLESRSGESRWQRDLGSPVSASPVMTRERVFVASQSGAIFALNRENGQRRWTSSAGGLIGASPVLCGTLLLVITNEGLISLFDAESGKIEQQLALGAPVFASPAISGRWCVVGTQQGDMYLLESQP
jgi:outer membrane protein assembly factor BamB